MMWGEDMYYFLDVDGVLNRESDWCKPFTVNPICVRNFKKLLSNDKDSHVILSSTWRQGFTNAGIKSSIYISDLHFGHANVINFDLSTIMIIN